ncbi:hypothetical protein ACK2FW_03505 [Clostridioides difficile]
MDLEVLKNIKIELREEQSPFFLMMKLLITIIKTIKILKVLCMSYVY